MLRRRAVIDLDAFRAQVAGDLLDARADAYGHGLELIAPAARAAGVRRLVVSDARDLRVARRAGFGDDDLLLDRGWSDPSGDATAAYGLSPAARPVLSLVGELVALKRVPADVGVSYGYTYRTAASTTLALIGLGYADGVPRFASNRGRVRLGGETFPLVGRIAMDQLVLDLGDAEGGRGLELGSEAILFGDSARGEPSVLDWATWTERSPLALTAGLATRVQRVAR